MRPVITLTKDPLLGLCATTPCAANCGLHILVDRQNPPTEPVTCLSCEQKAGKVLIKDGNTIKVLSH